MDTIIAMNKLQTLLHALAKLYSGMFANILHERVSAYHANDDSDSDNDIGASLRTYIKNVKQHAAANPTPLVNRSGVTEPTLPAVAYPEQSDALADKPDIIAISNPLSNYFKKNKSSSELAPPLSEKLKASAWEHTHSVIRLAHMGDYSSAKLHAELANNALHELKHYMPEADFNAFKSAVKAELLSKS